MPADAYSFALAWRWTQPTHNVLPPEAMARITPIAHTVAPLGVTARGDLERSSFDDVQAASAAVSCEDGTRWLRTLPIVLPEQVTVRWDTATAIQTTWEIFTQYWDDFCYPSSDDVEVFPASGDWLLLYHHWERFEWGRRRQRR
jgi:hypothetical protein